MCQGKTRKDGARPALFLVVVLLYVFFCVLCIFCVVLCIVCFVTFPVLFVCICVLNYCHRVATQLQLNISYNNTRGTGGLLTRGFRSDVKESTETQREDWFEPFPNVPTTSPPAHLIPHFL